MTAVFLLRIDSLTGKGEGEVYYAKESGIINCNFWSSRKLIGHRVIMATGKKNIDAIFEEYYQYHITEGVYKTIA